MNDEPCAAVFKPLDEVPLADDPIEPAWVLEGQPRARSGRHSTNTDGWAWTWHWDCTAGRFRWHYGWEETILVVEGEVAVTDEQGRRQVLRAGSVGYFPAGSWWVWEVPHYVRKLAFNRRSVPRPARLVAGLLRRLGAPFARRLPPPLPSVTRTSAPSPHDVPHPT
jgi:uncharacterized protein